MPILTPLAGCMKRRHDQYVVLHCPFDGANGSTIITDTTVRHVLTAAGNAQISTAQAKWGQSLLLDGTGDYVTIPKSADFAFGTDNYTIDLVMRPTTYEGHLFSQGEDANNRQGLFITSDDGGSTVRMGWLLKLSGVSYGITVDPIAISMDTWHHIALVRSASNLTTLFLNGVSQGTETDSYSIPEWNAVFNLGRRYADGGGGWEYFTGNFDELRISKGIARWTANFTPPTSPY